MRGRAKKTGFNLIIFHFDIRGKLTTTYTMRYITIKVFGSLYCLYTKICKKKL